MEANKYVTGSSCYNMRVVECRLAAVLLAKKMGLKWKEVRKFIHVQQQCGLSSAQLADKVKELLHESPYTIEEVAKELEMSVEQVTKDYLGIVKNTSFECYKRALHVWTETSRVYNFNDICTKPHYEEQLNHVGALMDQSHHSCSKLFECSCPELDTLTEICRKAGALGSRLTGAGWGGCTVSLVPKEKLNHFFDQVKKEYYNAVLHLDPKKLEKGDILFATGPGSGAAIYMAAK